MTNATGSANPFLSRGLGLPSSPCRHPGCPALATYRGYCPAHTREAEAGRPSSSARGYGARWRRIRRMHLCANPLCEDCRAQGRVTPATEVHHVVPLRDGGTHGETNLRALCKSCHSKRTARGE